MFFFFQAEDGIRDGHVTGVQTCALPISGRGQLSVNGLMTSSFSMRNPAWRSSVYNLLQPEIRAADTRTFVSTNAGALMDFLARPPTSAGARPCTLLRAQDSCGRCLPRIR